MHDKAKIIGIASYVPSGVLTNEQLASDFPSWSVEKIFEKTGISSRPIALEDDTCSGMAVKAAENLFKKLSISANDIDYILLCTQSPDYKLPTTACLVQHLLGIPTSSGALDFNLGCSGYVYGLSLAKGLVETGQGKNVLLITSELYSRYINKNDKSVRTLFGDSATATLISACTLEEEQIGSFVFGSDGSGADMLTVPHGGSTSPLTTDSFLEEVDSSGNTRSKSNLYMNGAELLTFTLNSVPKLVSSILCKAQMDIEQIDKVVFHQANKFMVERLRKKTRFNFEQCLLSYEKYGNTVSSTIPLGLELAEKKGQLHKGDVVLLCGFGVGYSWAGNIITW